MNGVNTINHKALISSKDSFLAYEKCKMLKIQLAKEEVEVEFIQLSFYASRKKYLE